MTDQEFQAFLGSLPPETRDLVLERMKTVAEYAARATHARRRMREQFPNMNPRVAAALSLVVARFT